MNLTNDILNLSMQLIKIPGVTVGPEIRYEEVKKTADFIKSWFDDNKVPHRLFEDGDFPAILAGLPGNMEAGVMLSGHYDVVAPEPDDSQFLPRIDGDYLWGRGSADMKTVVATYMVWLREMVKNGPPFPNINLLLVGNEEIGETEPIGTGHALKILDQEGYQPDIFIAGERTEESGQTTWGQVCTENRGLIHFQVLASGVRAHSGMSPLAEDLTQKLINARRFLSASADKYLTLNGPAVWRSQIRFPFVRVGSQGVYNITPDHGVLGVEIRSIPGEPMEEMMAEFEKYARQENLQIDDLVMEQGSACGSSNPFLQKLIESVREESGQEPHLGKKLAGTSARFAPNGDGVVWGQSGIGPHSADERHFIPSIEPYYRALNRFGQKTID